MNFNEEGNFITLRELPAGMSYLGAVKLEHNLWVAIKEIDFPQRRLEYTVVQMYPSLHPNPTCHNSI